MAGKVQPPGKPVGSVSPKPDEVEAMLASIVEHGGVRPAARATGVERHKLARAAAGNAKRLSQLRAEAARARAERTAATLAHIGDDVDEARKALRAIIDNPDASPGQKTSAAAGLIQIAQALHGQDRLNEGLATGITADVTKPVTPAEVSAELDRLFRDPTARAVVHRALAGQAH